MRKSWRTLVCIVLASVWPQLGCVQTPAGKSVQELRPVGQKPSTAKKQDLTAMDIAQAWPAQVDQLQKERKLNEAIVLCEDMRRPGSPHAAQATRKLASLYDQMEDLDRAIDEYKRVLQQSPRDADILAKIGDMFARQGRWAAAEKWYDDALAQQPKHASARSGLAFALAQQKEYDRSLKEYMKIPVSEAEAYCSVAFVMQLQGRRQDAARAYEQALKIDANFDRARKGLMEMQQSFVIEPPVTPDPQAPKDSSKKGVVQLEPAPTTPPLETGRVSMPRPTLPPLPDIGVPK